MGANAHGFHAAYVVRSGQATELGAPNALVGAYLNKIGLPDRAIVYITKAPPDSMTWLTLKVRSACGIIAASATLKIGGRSCLDVVAALPNRSQRKLQ